MIYLYFLFYLFVHRHSALILRFLQRLRLFQLSCWMILIFFLSCNFSIWVRTHNRVQFLGRRTERKRTRFVVIIIEIKDIYYIFIFPIDWDELTPLMMFTKLWYIRDIKGFVLALFFFWILLFLSPKLVSCLIYSFLLLFIILWSTSLLLKIHNDIFTLWLGLVQWVHLECEKMVRVHLILLQTMITWREII